MSITITMPALSPTMEEGNLAKWMVKPGDAVAPGQVIAEIETDKATMEVEAVDEGVVEALLVPAGAQGVKVNTPIATLRTEDAPAARPAPAPVVEAPRPTPSAPPPVQAAPVTVLRDEQEETGWYGINVHRGGPSSRGPGSEGCSVIPPAQWPAFIELMKTEMRRNNAKTLSYVLTSNS